MLKIEVDATGPIARLGFMEAKLEAFPMLMHAEVVLWQTEDMHRKYPNMEPDEQRYTGEGQSYSASTLIWPHSRLQLTTGEIELRGITERARKHPGRKLPRWYLQQAARRRTMRPVLRPELFTRFCERERALLLKTIKWK